MGFRIPLVKSIKRRRKARPGTTTQQAKLRSPIKDCSSFRVTLFREQKAANWVRHLASLSSGRRASIKVACSRLSVVGDGEKGRAREKNEKNEGGRLSVVGDGEKGRAREKNEKMREDGSR